MTALVWFGIGFAAAPGPATRTSTGPGRAVMSAMRTVNDVRVVSRGRGASGRRLLRRQAFRTLRRR